MKERDDKHAKLNSRFGGLSKRWKQRIQEFQKDKYYQEARPHDINVKEEVASTQQITTQEMERICQQANEALRLADAERQQLCTTNSKLRDNVDEVLRSLEVKENTLEGLLQSLSKKEQALTETQRAMQSLEEKQQLLIADLSTKFQKQVECLESQLALASTERSNAAETIASLQMLLAEKDSKIVEIEADSSAEAARLGVALEKATVKFNQLKYKHDKMLDLEAESQALRAKLEASENARLQSEFEAAKMKNKKAVINSH